MDLELDSQSTGWDWPILGVLNMSEVGTGYSKDSLLSKLRLRPEVLVTPQETRGRRFYHLELPSEGKFFRVGAAEYVFISLLDGNTSFAEALALSSRALGVDALSQTHASEVYQWLIDQRLAEITDTRVSPRNQPKPGVFSKLNPLWIKIPFGSPDAFLKPWVKWMGWLYTPPALILGTLFILCVGISVIQQREKFTHDLRSVISASNWLWLALTWAILKFLHECSHAIACRKFGGRVREAGLIFILLAPMAYVDVTSAWRLPSRWQRALIAAAGVYFEMLCAAVAAVLWIRTDSALAAQWLCNVMIMATLTTVLFNINPLMKFDGYFILSDLLAVPNLFQRANQQASQYLQAIFFGAPLSLEVKGIHGKLLAGYGFATMVWRSVMTLGMILAATVMFQGLGVFLAILGAVTWWGIPLTRFLSSIQRRWIETPLSLVRSVAVAGSTAAVSILVVMIIPWPGRVIAPAIVEFADDSVLRARVPGFIQVIHVTDGQLVEAGTVLMELANEKIGYEYAEVEEKLNRERTLHRQAIDQHRAAQAQISQRKIDAFEKRFKELELDRESLQVRATTSGRVIARGLERRLGSYVQQGDELVAIEDDSNKELIVSMRSDQLDSVNELLGKEVTFFAAPEIRCRGVITRVDPRASNAIPHAALSSEGGGALPVRQVSKQADKGKTELVEPRLTIKVALDEAAGDELNAGQRGHVHLGWRGRTILERVWSPIHEWIEGHLK